MVPAFTAKYCIASLYFPHMNRPFVLVVTVDVAVVETDVVPLEDTEDVAVDDAVLVADRLADVVNDVVAVLDAVLVPDVVNDVVAVDVFELVTVVELLYVHVAVEVGVVLKVVVAELVCVVEPVDVAVVVGDVNSHVERSTVPSFNAVSARLRPSTTAPQSLKVRKYPVAAHRTSKLLLKVNFGKRSTTAVEASLQPEPAMCIKPFTGVFMHSTLCDAPEHALIKSPSKRACSSQSLSVPM